MKKLGFKSLMAVYALSYPLTILLAGLAYWLSFYLNLGLMLLLGLAVFFGLMVVKIGLLTLIQQDLQPNAWASWSIFIGLGAGIFLAYKGYYLSQDLSLAYQGQIYEARNAEDLPSNPDAYYFFVYPQALEPKLNCSPSRTISRTSKHRSGGTNTMQYHLQIYGLGDFQNVFLALIDQGKQQPKAQVYFRQQLNFKADFQAMALSCSKSSFGGLQFWQGMEDSPQAFKKKHLQNYLAYLGFSALFALFLAWSNRYFT